ncbi:MAG: TetR family transcriptional regulator, partial [Eggerthellaceae bacterium]|nr:TetR family transcriptional regulator [Eggerthellaceae bacterium]
MADTKKLYCDTLLRLCETQPLNRITVTALIKETHTARQTFYNNFRD